VHIIDHCNCHLWDNLFLYPFEVHRQVIRIHGHLMIILLVFIFCWYWFLQSTLSINSPWSITIFFWWSCSWSSFYSLTCQKYNPLWTSNKYHYGDRTLATNVASSNNYPPNDILTIDIGEYKCMIVDPIVVVENIKITKKRKKELWVK